MRVADILAVLMDGRKPRGAALRDPLGKCPDQLRPLQRMKLAGQGHHDLGENPGVFPVGPFLPVQPPAGRVAPCWHPLGHDLGLRIRAGDIADVRPGGPGRMR